MNRALCICAHIPFLQLKTKITLVIHVKELKRTTNTGRLALKALGNCEMRIRGVREVDEELQNDPLDLSDLLTDEYRTLLLYPSDQAIDLTPELVKADSKPIQLIVPDGNWRQASKVHFRHHELKNIPRVKVPLTEAPEFLMRAEHKTDGMATLQAIAHALGVIEGEKTKEILLKLYELKLRQTLIGRGTLT